MPLPFVLLGAALVTGGFGAKKGKDAYDDFKGAKERNDRAARWVREGERTLEEARETLKDAMFDLAALKSIIYKDELLPFVEAFERIKRVDFHDNFRIDGDLPAMDSYSFDDMRATTLEMKDVLQGGLTSMSSGAVAGLAAYGGVGFLGTASTGTAIGGLSGAAATNATLAWLGGGSLASGGFGMAGGMAVLGGVVAGPVLAVGGLVASSKAKEALENARSNQAQAEQARDQMLAAADVAKGIARRCKEIHDVLFSLVVRFRGMRKALEGLVDSNQHYPSYTDAQKKLVFTTAALATVLKAILEYKLIDEQGSLTPESRHAVEEGERALLEVCPDAVASDKPESPVAQGSLSDKPASSSERLIDKYPELEKYRAPSEPSKSNETTEPASQDSSGEKPASSSEPLIDRLSLIHI